MYINGLNFKKKSKYEGYLDVSRTESQQWKECVIIMSYKVNHCSHMTSL